MPVLEGESKEDSFWGSVGMSTRHDYQVRDALFHAPRYLQSWDSPLEWEGMLCSLSQEGKGQPFSHNPLWKEAGRKGNKRIGENSENETQRGRRKSYSFSFIASLSLSLFLSLPGGVGRGGCHLLSSRSRLSSSSSSSPLLTSCWGHFSPQTPANKSLASLDGKVRQWEIDWEMCTLRKYPLTSDSLCHS